MWVLVFSFQVHIVEAGTKYVLSTSFHPATGVTPGMYVTDTQIVLKELMIGVYWYC